MENYLSGPNASRNGVNTQAPTGSTKTGLKAWRSSWELGFNNRSCAGGVAVQL